jgi:hypothetical protein
MYNKEHSIISPYSDKEFSTYQKATSENYCSSNTCTFRYCITQACDVNHVCFTCENMWARVIDMWNQNKHMWMILSHVVPVSHLDHESFTCGFLVRVTSYSPAFHYSIISTRFKNKMDCTPRSMCAHWLLQSHTHPDFRWVYPAVRRRTWMCYGKVQFRGFTLLAQQVTYNGTAWRRLQWKIQKCLRLLCKTYVFQLSW